MSNSNPTGFESDNVEAPPQDRGLFDCFGKKHEKEDVPMAEAEHKPSLVEKLHRSNSSSSSSSEEEVEEDGKKIRRRKKKGLTDKIKEKLPGHKTKDASEEIHQDAEKKGILEKIKEKLPSHQKDESLISTAPAPTVVPTPPHYQPNEYSGGILGEDYKDEAFFAPAPAPASALAHDGGLVEEHNKDEAFFAPAPIPAVAHDVVPTPPHCQSGGGQCGKAQEANESEEKKGIIGKIMDMFPGGHKDGDEPKKDH